MALLEQITILGLHGKRDVVIPFRGQNCVLIGPNGSGKSTALQIVAYALGRQWRSLAELSFSSLKLEFQGGLTGTITKADCEHIVRFTRSGRKHMYPPVLTYSAELIDSIAAVGTSNEDIIFKIAENLDVSPLEIKRLQRQLAGDATGKAVQKNVNSFIDVLDKAALPYLIYLPTYRRIELELKKLLDELPESYKRSIDSRQNRESEDRFITEIVRFGMEDISKRIAAFEKSTRDFARNKFNIMMASYIKEMANSQALSVKELRSINIDKNLIEITLSRIEEGILDANEKEGISQIILDLAEGKLGGTPPFHKKWLAHFFLKLHHVNQEIEHVEYPITRLAEILNKYLNPKAVSYDNENYHLNIKDEYNNEIGLQHLSSGEKQVTSILTELYFRTEPFNIFVDEPELSLSVPWQVDFLEDIKKAPSCRQIFAVTHSPFIYDNSFGGSVFDFSRI